ncbi:racemase, partial [Candidatus Pelagibacter sp.]|nr:racemase [Candidatus Pelagibacter sp.]
KAELTTPSTAAIKALKKLKVKKLAIFTPYSKKLNNDVVEYFKEEKFEVVSNSYLDIAADYDIGKVDQDFIYDSLVNMNIEDADALFISCTALPVLNIIDRLEKKLNKPVLSSNQTLIWDTLEKIGKNNNIKGFGSLFSNS